jgi:mono/diheme cytochrome c family protein
MKRSVLVLAVMSASACTCSGGPAGDGGTGGSSGSGGGGGGTSGSGGGAPQSYTDFPATPVLDAVPATISAAFADAGTSAAPCVVEPEDGTLFPKDWLRPRFSFAPAGGEDAFEITVRAPNQTNALVVFTANTTWTMPRGIWSALTADSVDLPITVDVLGLVQATGVVTSAAHATFRIAPASASGAIVYWTTSNGTALKGFRVGDESVETVLVPPQVPGSQCVGCHTSTPDGVFAAFSSSSQSGNGDPSSIGIASVDGGAMPLPFLSASAAQLLARVPQQAPAFSAGHWTSGDHIAISNFDPGGGFELVWTDLEAASTDLGTGWGVIARTGDTGFPATPAFSHDGSKLVYASAPSVSSGVTVSGGADIFTVPYGNRAGGTAAAVMGANDPAFNECYPGFSPDDALIAFARVPSGQTSYNNAAAEIFVVPAGGAAMAHRIRGNDPPACVNHPSPGITNSWPKWGPTVTSSELKTYYWLTFSSVRVGGRPQLFVAPVVVEGGTLTSYPALYLWNQPAGEANHTPAWDLFQIAPIIN